MAFIDKGNARTQPRTRSVIHGLTLLGLVLLGCHQSASATASTPLAFQGRAFDLDTGQLVYTEEHEYKSSGLYTVIYREPDGQQFASKTADFSATPFAPSVDQHNDRNGEIIRIARKDNRTLTVTYRETRHNAASTVEFVTTETTVVDAGFHPYVVMHWDSLVSGAITHAEYIVPFWLRRITLTIKAVDCASGRQCFTIKPTNALLALLVTTIELTYDAQSRQLLEFRGTSNIAQRNGDYHRVRIVYEYPPTTSAVANATTD